jgi:hypothetical protein
MKRHNWEHGFVSVVLLCQIACLTMFAFAEDLIRQSKWVGAFLGFTFVFGLILSLGFYGMLRERSDELSLFRFLQAEPVYLAVAIATAGQAASILLVKSG